jgi:phosphoenolpyruvate carboxykinase (GTP)
VPAIDWQGRPYDPNNGPAAHPNSRFTVSARHCPSWTEKMDDPSGVPISAIIFGGRREALVPLVFEARDWNHGVLVGAAMGSETTAAATGAVGVMRRDSMAMKPFCGYNFADYFSHWLSFPERASKLPKIFHVNWFRKGADGKFLWPGFGDNMRVLEWIVARCEGKAGAQETPIGFLPRRTDLDLTGLDLPPERLDELLAVDVPGWRKELAGIGEYLFHFHQRAPAALWREHARLGAALEGGGMGAALHTAVQIAATS